MSALSPRLDVLPQEQLALWPSLKPFREFGFVLYGGTALALRLGHRQSIDFDFFSDRRLEKDALVVKLPLLETAQTIQEEAQTWTVLVPSKDATVKLSLFGELNLSRVGEPDVTDDQVCEVASKLDIFGTKLKVLLQRIEARDYRDIIALLKSGESLERGLGAARALYGSQFQPSEALKAMTYFEGGDLELLSESERTTLIDAASKISSVESIPIMSRSLSARRSPM